MTVVNKKIWIALVCILLIWYYFCLPKNLFINPTCTVLNDIDNELLGASIADDGQWRFPYDTAVPQKFKQAIVTFEDKTFFYHIGFNPASIARALCQNFKSKKKVSGGSSLSMQVIRLSRKGKRRTIFEKMIEIILATRLELRYSKNEILSLYASNAPFGSNVIGLDAAAWRYFGRSVNELSWAETAVLAVLPNAPSLIYPGKNETKLKAKRNRLLQKLCQRKIIDQQTLQLALLEPLPNKPLPLPNFANHLLNRASKENQKGKLVRSSISKNLQIQVNQIMNQHQQQLEGNQIFNAAALVLDVKTGNALCYVGNSGISKGTEHGNKVDIITSNRSTGSILKPFLYSFMLSEGLILPNTLIPDIPLQIGGFVPQNYNLTYDGVVPAKTALARSLNIPAVRMLQMYGIEKFNFNLKRIGMNSLNYPSSHYGLSIILGGAEGNLWNICGMYASMARILNNHKFQVTNVNDVHEANYLFEKKSDEQRNLSKSFFLDAASIKLTFDAMVEVSRPDQESAWQSFSSSNPIAWKTGTSFGYRDAWAIGVTPSYVIGVWVGNASGEGRPGLTGIGTAAPILFDVFNLLRKNEWFQNPKIGLTKVEVCSLSGYQKSMYCENSYQQYVPKAGIKTEACPYHRLIHLDKTKTFRVNSTCESTDNMVHVPWFVLPPSQEWYYKSKNLNYKTLPPFKLGCESQNLTMELIYPKDNAIIYVPKELDGTFGKTIFQVAHRNKNISIYWHLDEQFVGTTYGIHELGLNPVPGKHIITLIDENGEVIKERFEILEKKK